MLSFSSSYTYRRRLALSIIGAGALLFGSCGSEQPPMASVATPHADTTISFAPDTATIPQNALGDSIRYGRELLLHTARYLGPGGSVGHYLGNRMNCGNCHLDAGSRPFALPFYNTYRRYPQYRGRENAVLSLADRINNCIERPHNGSPMPKDAHEMRAIIAYIKWLSENAPADTILAKIEGTALSYSTRAASPQRGSTVFATHCASCHGADGQGVLNADSISYQYPPLWGMGSYQAGSSMHRVLKLARFVKANMPDKKAHWNMPVLSDEEAIDVAAFINDDSLHPRPVKKGNMAHDYPVYKNKPIDYDIGPFEDTFSAQQHKFGPYTPIIEYHRQHGQPVVF